MSLVDEARAVRERIAARLRELEPLVAEYNELQRVAAEMGVEAQEALLAASPRPGEPAPKRQPPPRRARRSDSSHTRSRLAASDDSNDQFARLVLQAVRDQPGKTVAEYAELLGLSPARLYRPIRELTTAGVIVKRARQLFPA